MTCKIFQVQTAKNNSLAFKAACSVTAPLALAPPVTGPTALAVGPPTLVAQPPNRGSVTVYFLKMFYEVFKDKMLKIFSIKIFTTKQTKFRYKLILTCL